MELSLDYVWSMDPTCMSCSCAQSGPYMGEVGSCWTLTAQIPKPEMVQDSRNWWILNNYESSRTTFHWTFAYDRHAGSESHIPFCQDVLLNVENRFFVPSVVGLLTFASGCTIWSQNRNRLVCALRPSLTSGQGAQERKTLRLAEPEMSEDRNILEQRGCMLHTA